MPEEPSVAAASRRAVVRRHLVAAVAFVPGLLVLSFAVSLSRAFFGERYSMAAAFAAVATLALVVFVAATHRRLPRAGAAAAGNALVWAPGIFYGVMDRLDHAIVAGPPGSAGRGLDSIMMIVAVPVIVAVHVVLGAGLSYLFARGANGALRYLALGSTALVVLAVGLSLTRVGRPDPDTFLSTFTRAGEIRPGEAKTFAGRTITFEERSIRIPDPPRSNGSDSTLSGPTPPGTGIDSSSCTVRGIAFRSGLSYESDDCSPLVVRLDPQGTYALVEQTSAWVDTKSAFVLPSWEPIEIRPSTVASRLSPPIGWTVGAGITGAIALLLVGLSARARRRANAVAGTDATHVGDGVVELANGERVRVPAAAALRVGPVLLVGAAERAASYRDGDALTFTGARSGSLDSLRTRALDLAASLDGVATAAACMGAASLVACRIFGLL